jgi:VanZ family protein
MKFIPLTIISLISIVYAIYTKDNETPFMFDKFKLRTSIKFDYLLNSLFKLKHILHYIITYWLGLYAFGKNEHKKVILFCLVLGLFIEILQGFVPTRGGSLTDIAPNILGILIGYTTSIVLKFKTN